MHVISRKRLKEFWGIHTDAELPLRSWYKVATAAKWENFADIRNVYPSADKVGKCVVFNIGGNKFRLIVTASLKYGRLYVRSVMTHEEYNQNRWREECLCPTK